MITFSLFSLLSSSVLVPLQIESCNFSILRNIFSMTKVKQSLSIIPETVSPRCRDMLKKVSSKKSVDLTKTGDSRTNLLLNFLQCQVKATKTCMKEEKSYSNCHKSVMGTGSYDGRRDCGCEMEKLYYCVTESL